MVTIDDVIRAYYLHKSQGMMNALNNLHKKYSMQKNINQSLSKDLFEGVHQERLKYERKIHYAATFWETCYRLKPTSLLTDTSIKNFEDLYDEVDNLLLKKSKVRGIGRLTVYDIALRIGYIRQNQILPKDKIYLFAGANSGANQLFLSSPSFFTIPTSTTRIKEGRYDMTIFNSPLRDVPSFLLEDMFCVFHTLLGKLSKISYARLQKVPSYVIQV